MAILRNFTYSCKKKFTALDWLHDISILLARNGATNVRAGFGTRVTNNNDWQAQEVCWTERLALGSTYQVDF